MFTDPQSLSEGDVITKFDSTREGRKFSNKKTGSWLCLESRVKFVDMYAIGGGF